MSYSLDFIRTVTGLTTSEQVSSLVDPSLSGDGQRYALKKDNEKTESG